ncbi:MAG: hypothetical protein HOP11_06655 [Saprospiraceae bacterium]|nr:hypothetical protein [Saprospiraceae bacterium]
MKNIYLILMLLAGRGSFAQNVLIEDFIYNPIDSLENSGNWGRSGVNLPNNIKVVSPGLIYNDYGGSGRGNCCEISNNGDGDILVHSLTSAIKTGALYLSLMLRIDSLPSTVSQGYCTAFNATPGGSTNLNTRLYIKRITDTTYDLGISKQGDIKYTGLIFDLYRTNLVVVKYSFINGMSNDSASLYVFKSGVPKTEPGKAQAVSVLGDDELAHGALYLSNNYAQSTLTGINIKVDGLRVGTSWENSVLSGTSSVSIVKSTNKILIQNYPNPIKQNTIIHYQLPSKGFVKLNIYKPSGELCAELLNGVKEEGDHEIDWDANNLQGGLYVCKLQFNGDEIIHKLLRIE